MGISVLWALLATLGFSLLANLRPRDILIATIGGGLTWATYRLGLKVLDLGLFSYFFAATVAGLYAELFALIGKHPATLYSVAAIFSLVPGGGMYYCLSAALKNDSVRAMNLGVETMLIAGFIAGGIALASSIAQLIKRIRQQKRVTPRER
jgi:uncharacterized membrane protein YjjB (DUF3815 family)